MTVEIDYNLSLFDHFPLTCKFNLILEKSNSQSVLNKDDFILWNKMSDKDINIYQNNIKDLIHQLDLKELMCSNDKCSNKIHLKNIDNFYEQLLIYFHLALLVL